MHHQLMEIAWLTGLSMSALWLGWKLKLPAIVFFLIAGFIAGPGLQLIHPDALFGDLLQPVISIAVGIILFEGALTLNFREVSKARFAIRHIVIIGAPVSWILTALAAHYVAGLSWPVAISFGALLIVTGPTVIIPLLKNARLKDRTGSILKWEGIVNDPIGAILAVLSYEYFAKYYAQSAPLHEFIIHIVISLLAITAASLIFGSLLAKMFNKGLMPEYLKAPFLLSFVVVFFVLCNELLHESGLVGVTILGMTLANLGIRSIEEIKKFKESISVMLVSGLFIILTARINPDILLDIRMQEVAFLFVVLFLIRPATAFASSIGTSLTRKETAYIGWIAPRGIVCAAIAGVMGPQLVQAGYPDGEHLLPLAFAIVLLTVFLHGLSAKPLAQKLGLAHEDRSNIIIVGASEWTIQLAETLMSRDIKVLLTDNDWYKLKKARLTEIPTYYGEILSEETEHHIELTQYSSIFSATSNIPYNALVCTKFAHEFGRDNTYQLLAKDEEAHERRHITETLAGHHFANEDMSYWDYRDLYQQGWRFKATRIGGDFNADGLEQSIADGTIMPIGMIKKNGAMNFDIQGSDYLKDDCVLIFFTKPEET